MKCKIKSFIAGAMLLLYVLTNAGCAAVWFLAGAGAAATVATVAMVNEKEEAEKKTVRNKRKSNDDNNL